MTLETTIALTTAIALSASRKLTLLQPLWSRIDPRWQWLPPALVTALSLLVERVAGAASWDGYVEAMLLAAVVIILAASPGREQSSRGEEVAPRKTGPGPGPTVVSIVCGLTLIVLAVGCSGSARPVLCSPAAGEALTLVCEDAIEHAPTTKDAEDIHDGCVALVRSRSRRCR